MKKKAAPAPRKDVAALKKDAAKHFKARRIGDALGLWLQAHQLAPDDGEVLAGLGTCAALSGDATKAAELFARAVSSNPDSAEHLHNVGNALMVMGQLHAALVVLLAARDVAPRNAMIHQTIAKTLLASQLHEQARDCLDFLVQNFPKLPGTHLLLANLAVVEKRPKDAVKYLRREIERMPKSVDAHKALGGVLLVEGDRAGAKKAFEAALALRPRDAELGALVKATR